LEVVKTSKFVASHVGFAKVNCFGVSFADAVGDHYGSPLARNVFNVAKARVVATLLLALLGVNRLGDVRRGESDFYIPRGNLHGGRGGCACGDHGDWIAMVVQF
jgi:hypothetical protein